MRLFSAQKLKGYVSEPAADSSLWSFLGDSLHIYEGRVFAGAPSVLNFILSAFFFLRK